MLSFHVFYFRIFDRFELIYMYFDDLQYNVKTAVQYSQVLSEKHYPEEVTYSVSVRKSYLVISYRGLPGFISA